MNKFCIKTNRLGMLTVGCITVMSITLASNFQNESTVAFSIKTNA